MNPTDCLDPVPTLPSVRPAPDALEGFDPECFNLYDAFRVARRKAEDAAASYRDAYTNSIPGWRSGSTNFDIEVAAVARGERDAKALTRLLAERPRRYVRAVEAVGRCVVAHGALRERLEILVDNALGAAESAESHALALVADCKPDDERGALGLQISKAVGVVHDRWRPAMRLYQWAWLGTADGKTAYVAIHDNSFPAAVDDRLRVLEDRADNRIGVAGSMHFSPRHRYDFDSELTGAYHSPVGDYLRDGANARVQPS